MEKKGNRNVLIKSVIALAAIILGYVAVYYMMEGGILSRQMTSLIPRIGINIILAVSLSITVGFLGELSLGHAGFMAIGAYASAIFTTQAAGLPGFLSFVFALIIGGVMAALFGVLTGIPVLRLRGDYLAIVTLAFTEIIRSVINTMSITGGAMGLSSIPEYANCTWIYIFGILTILVAVNLKKSRHGRAILSVRENYVAAEAMGIPVTKFKILAFTVAAFFAGIAGALYAHTYSVLRPGNFDYNKSIDILIFVVLGGMGNIPGTIVATILLTYLPEKFREFGDYRMLTYALALIIIMLLNSGEMKEKIKGFFRKIVPQGKVKPKKLQEKKGEH